MKSTNIIPLDILIEKDGIAEYIRDYYSAITGNLKILYTKDDFYIAEDTTYQPWISIMGHIPENMTEQQLFNILSGYIENDKYIAVYTNIEQISIMLQKFDVLTYHEDFLVAIISKIQDTDDTGIRLATLDDLPYIESTYSRSGHQQLFNRISKKQMWVLEDDKHIKGYAGIHKDYSLGFEYVEPNSRQQNIASRIQLYIAKYMIENNLIPYVMISVENDIAKRLQTKLESRFSKTIFYFYAKGSYEFE